MFLKRQIQKKKNSYACTLRSLWLNIKYILLFGSHDFLFLVTCSKKNCNLIALMGYYVYKFFFAIIYIRAMQWENQCTYEHLLIHIKSDLSFHFHHFYFLSTHIFRQFNRFQVTDTKLNVVFCRKQSLSITASGHWPAVWFETVWLWSTVNYTVAYLMRHNHF